MMAGIKALQVVSLKLDGEDLGRLDAWAAEQNMTRSEVIRLAVARLIKSGDGATLGYKQGMLRGLHESREAIKNAIEQMWSR